MGVWKENEGIKRCLLPRRDCHGKWHWLDKVKMWNEVSFNGFDTWITKRVAPLNE